MLNYGVLCLPGPLLGAVPPDHHNLSDGHIAGSLLSALTRIPLVNSGGPKLKPTPKMCLVNAVAKVVIHLYVCPRWAALKGSYPEEVGLPEVGQFLQVLRPATCRYVRVEKGAKQALSGHGVVCGWHSSLTENHDTTLTR